MIERVGVDVPPPFRPGQAVGFMAYGAFSECLSISYRQLIPLPVGF